MKQFMISLFAVTLLSLGNVALAVNDDQIHEEARFIADKLAYQFGLDKEQLTDAYEINYDFLKAVYPLEAALAAGDEKTIIQYYAFLDERNANLVWIMDNSRYTNFKDVESLFRPVYIKDGKIQLRVYELYGKNKFFEGKPKKFGKYKGEHSPKNPDGTSFYQGKYRHIVYGGQPRLLNSRNKALLNRARKADFGK